MKTDDIFNREFYATAYQLKTYLTAEQWRNVCDVLISSDMDTTRNSIIAQISSLLNPDSTFLLQSLIERTNGNANSRELGLMLHSMSGACEACENNSPAEIVWTGPTTRDFPIRRMDQVLYDLINTAEHSILLVTFAAAKVKTLQESLLKAISRGVEVTMVLEFEEESGGQLTFDAVKAFSKEMISKMHIYYWPIEKRERNQLGRPGKLHVKCAVIDNCAVITSANLTDDAFNRNMEMGVLFRKGEMPSLIREQFLHLVMNNILEEYCTDGGA
jgi:phosphatidylserine/phosphatidylglycerophosphate/cardiolipin synthase-like enzyme